MTGADDLWTGKAGQYDQARPTPPTALLDLLTQVARQPRPALVVDLGSGTGLSTAVWGERAERVIGIEPNADMRQAAERSRASHPYAAQIEYRAGTAQQTGLPDGCAEIVTAAQSFHWMEPNATLTEIARILRPGGLFAAYDYDWPPTIDWELDQTALEMAERQVALIHERGLAQTLQMWPKGQHLARMRESGHFRSTREVALHCVEHGDAARYLAMARSSAFSHMFQFSDEEMGLDRLTQMAHDVIGSNPVPWYVSYRVRYGVK